MARVILTAPPYLRTNKMIERVMLRAAGGRCVAVCLCVGTILAVLASGASAQRLADVQPAGVTAVPDRQPALAIERADATGDVRDALQPAGRHTRRGLVIGGIVGGASGLAIGSFIALWCESGGETDGCLEAIPIVTVLGAASGAAAGAIIGAAIPRRGTVAASPADPATPARAARQRIGSASLAGGVAHAELHDWSGPYFKGSGTTVRANFLAELRPWFAIGPEAGIADFGNRGQVRHAALAMRTTADIRLAGLHPYAVVNFGAYDVTAPSIEFFGAALGAGIRWEPRERFFVDAEARLQRNAQNIEPMRMRAFSVGGGLYW
jgi:hypothetical protein